MSSALVNVSTADPPGGETRRAISRSFRPARKWQWLSVGSGLLLASAFFMPAAQGCNAPIVPARELWDGIKGIQWPTGWGDVLEGCGFVCVYLTAYLFGLLVAVSALARICRQERRAATFSLIADGLIILAGVVAISLIITGILASTLSIPSDLEDAVAMIGLCILSPLVFIHVLICLHRRRVFCYTFAGHISAVYWFAFWLLAVGREAYSGLFMSFAASCLLLVAMVGEAAALRHQRWRRTAWQLLTCRLLDPPDWRGHCPQCDYDLTGLPEPRCPECGCAFTWEEVGITPPQHSM